MKKIFLDTNILLDVFLERHPFCEPAQIIWSLVERKKLNGAISAISILNSFFIIKKLASTEKAYQAIAALQEGFKIIAADGPLLKTAYQGHFPDFEDAIQYYSAVKFKADAIISRDPSGFIQSKIPILDGPQFLALRK